MDLFKASFAMCLALTSAACVVGPAPDVPVAPAPKPAANLRLFVVPDVAFTSEANFMLPVEAPAALLEINVPKRLREAGYRVVASAKKPHDLDVKITGECHTGFTSPQCTTTIVVSTPKGQQVDNLVLEEWRYVDMKVTPALVVNRIGESQAMASFASTPKKKKPKAAAEEPAEEDEGEDE